MTKKIMTEATFERVGLIVNPTAGRGLMAGRIAALSDLLAEQGIAVQVWTTTSEPHSARDLARAATRSTDLVLACGGDGTVHGVVQGLAGTATALGVLPMGTANALARNLALPTDPVAALRKLLGYGVKHLPLGMAETADGPRWFAVMAGAGPDGSLVREMRLAAKRSAGRRAYYTEATRLFATRHFPAFRVEYRPVGSLDWQQGQAVAVMAARIADLGGLFGGLTAGCRLHHPHLVLQVLRPPAIASLPAWIGLGRLGLGRWNPWLQTVEAEEVRCLPLDGRREVHAQVDGEVAGPLPVSLRVVPGALHLLMP